MRYLEQGIKHVVNWILGPGEEMLNGKQQVGYDIVSAEEYKRNHEAFELQCRVTYYSTILYILFHGSIAHSPLSGFSSNYIVSN